MRATLTCYLLITLSASFLVNAADIEAGSSLNDIQAQENAMPTAVVQQVAQVLVIDQNDVLSIAADMAVAAAMAAATAAAAEDKTISSSGSIAVETSEPSSAITTDVAAGRDVADGIGAGEIIGEAQDEAVSEDANAMLQQANATSTYAATTTAESIMTAGSEFTFSPITLAPESSRSVARHSSKATQKPSAHVAPPAVAEKIKSSASIFSPSSSSFSIILFSIFSFTLSL
ncbi:uncharacterized protein EV154DRAFT_561611 [Mucor mucedo]|uniref:uncharacterized protein n=1 Tax=Mucor mucedo TaxID=29922 RepID=UPI00221EB2D1|nr:uncharacterized protein EV154DRAFT_561611 [Mucor mucedo]KAI7893148.1 hypothetical protein EV154DRAFT_561611 [Mucor mucedo]